MNQFSLPDTSGLDPRAYERLADVLPRLLAEESPESLLTIVADIVEEIVPCSAVLLYVNAEDSSFVPVVSRGALAADELAAAPRLRALEAAVAARMGGSLSPERQDVLVDVDATALEATAGVPLVVREQPLGYLVLRRRGVAQGFSDDERYFLSRLADVAAITLDKATSRAVLAELAESDALTGCLNRRGFMSALERVLGQAARDNAETSLITIDVDDLKHINDHLGHAAGDHALACTADTLRRRTRRGDVVGRLGGDEFAVVLAKAGPEEARTVCADLQDILLRARITTEKGEFTPRASFGIATTRTPGLSAQELLARSDHDLYANKRDRKKSQVP